MFGTLSKHSTLLVIDVVRTYQKYLNDYSIFQCHTERNQCFEKLRSSGLNSDEYLETSIQKLGTN
jgi:hypothetical protein